MNKVLLGLTTTKKSDWREKVDEISRYNIKEIALFPTFLEIEERRELYALLEKTRLQRIPHVHLRDDVEAWELDYCIKKYKTKAFNVHAQIEVEKLLKDNSKYKSIIYVENSEKINNMYINILKQCAGICLDVSHWADQGIKQKNFGYDKFLKLLKNYKVGCCHISAMTGDVLNWYSEYDNKHYKAYSRHYLKKMEEFDYVSDYIKYLPELISIELENSFKEQLEVKKYLEKLLLKRN